MQIQELEKKQSLPHCPILPNHTPKRNGQCSNILACRAMGQVRMRRCQEIRRQIVKDYLKTPEGQKEVRRMAKEKKVLAPTKETRKRSEAGKVPEQVEPASATFPQENKINKYGFLGWNQDILAALGISKGVDHKIIFESVNLEAKTVTLKIPDIRAPQTEKKVESAPS
jgi:hypothetical protein